MAFGLVYSLTHESINEWSKTKKVRGSWMLIELFRVICAMRVPRYWLPHSCRCQQCVGIFHGPSTVGATLASRRVSNYSKWWLEPVASRGLPRQSTRIAEGLKKVVVWQQLWQVLHENWWWKHIIAQVRRNFWETLSKFRIVKCERARG
jgi:hypothetical protein